MRYGALSHHAQSQKRYYSRQRSHRGAIAPLQMRDPVVQGICLVMPRSSWSNHDGAVDDPPLVPRIHPNKIVQRLLYSHSGELTRRRLAGSRRKPLLRFFKPQGHVTGARDLNGEESGAGIGRRPDNPDWMVQSPMEVNAAGKTDAARRLRRNREDSKAKPGDRLNRRS